MTWYNYNYQLREKRSALLRQLRYINRALKQSDLPISLVDRYKLRRLELDNYFAGAES